MKSLMSLALVAICTILKISAAGPPKESGERNFTLYTIDFRAQAEITRVSNTLLHLHVISFSNKFICVVWKHSYPPTYLQERWL